MNNGMNQNTLLLAGIGLAGFYLLTMRPRAQAQSMNNPATQYYRNATISPGQAGMGAGYLRPNNDATTYNMAGGLFNKLADKLFSKSVSYTPEMAGMPHASARDGKPYEPYEANFPTSSTQDATPANPVQTFSMDATDYGQYY